MLSLRKFNINSLYICPPHLHTVAILPWEIQKKFFQQYYSYILQIIYVISEEKLLPSYPPHLKNVTALPCKMHNFFIWLKVCYIPPNVGGSEKKLVVGWHWRLWKELVVMCGKWNVRQATLQQMFKVTTFCTDTCFESFLPLINCIIHHALLKLAMPQQDAAVPQLVRIANWYSIHMKNEKKMKNLCNFSR